MATRSPRRSRPTRRATRPEAMTTAGVRYLESSAVLAALLERDTACRRALGAEGRRVTSALTFAESARAIVRARADGRLSAADERAALRALGVLQRRCDVVAVTDAVLARAGRPFPVEPIRTLDAIHLATAEAFGEPPQLVTIVTRDRRIRDNAVAAGHPVE